MFRTSGDIMCHIELSDYCNAACPMCGRNDINIQYPHNMTTNQWVDSSQIRFTDIQKIFDDKFFNNYTLMKINLCGNMGDPAAAFDLYEICEYFFMKQPGIVVELSTNGGLKTKQYWKKLGQLFAKHNKSWSHVTFGIDGLQDTNHIYRQNVNFNKVMENAQAFIDGGGMAIWQFLVFKHNEHQIGEAKELSEKMGFEKFFIIHTPRFVREQKGDGYMVYTYKGKTHVLQTADPNFKFRQIASEFIDSEDTEEISCKAAQEREFYIDCKGRLLPCCWIGNSLNYMHGWGQNGPIRDQVMHLYDIDDMNVIHNDLTDTLQNEFFSKHMHSAWKDITTANTCKKFCSATKNIRKTHEFL